MKIRENKGFGILFVLMFFLTAAMGFTSLGHLGGTHMRNAGHNLQSLKAFYLAEAGLERTKSILKNEVSFQDGTALDGGAWTTVNLGDGQFRYKVENTADGILMRRKITGDAAVPTIASPKSTRAIEMIVSKPDNLPADFWDYSIYSGGDIDANGNAYDVNGDVIAGDDIEYTSDHFNNGEFEDPSASPLANLNYDVLKGIAQSQIYDGHDNYYTAAEIGVVPYPQDFYYTDPDPIAGTPGVPHVVYVEGDLTLNGNWGTMGGFIVVVGDVLTNPDAEADGTINGNGTIDGVLYTIGEFRINGGGAGGINITGGIFAADEVRLNGSTTVTYQQDYMDAIDAMGVPTGMTVLSWNEVASEI